MLNTVSSHPIQNLSQQNFPTAFGVIVAALPLCLQLADRYQHLRYNELMFFELFKWWYGSGWLEAWHSVPRSVKKVGLEFSIPVLLSNLFAPWKQIVALSGKSIDEKFRAGLDNIISRSIGFFVRFLTLVAAAVVISLSTVFSLAVALAWPLLPLAAVYFLIRAFTG
jgi:hypothetical protein